MFILKFSTANDTFENETQACALILRHVADQLDTRMAGRPATLTGGIIRDVNGNTVGKWELK